jgi:hypothetical protein
MLSASAAWLVRRRHRLDHPAGAHHRDAVGDRHDLAQLVGDQDDRAALVAQRPQHAEELVGLLRGQHAGRLVEDEDAGAAIERLQDLDALLQPDRQLADHGVGIDRQAVVAAERCQRLPGFRQAAGQQRPALGAQHDVLQHGEVVDQHEVLVDHADAGGDGVLGRADRHRACRRRGSRRHRRGRSRRGCSSASTCRRRSRRRCRGSSRARPERDVAVGVHRAEALVDADAARPRPAARPPRARSPAALRHEAAQFGQLFSVM